MNSPVAREELHGGLHFVIGAHAVNIVFDVMLDHVGAVLVWQSQH